MKKIFTIGWKDLLLILHDRGALLLMLGAPFVLTIGLGLVTGAFSNTGSGTGLADIPVVIINEDEGELGSALLDVFNADELADLLEPVTMTDVTEARRMVGDNEIAAVVIIPAGFTDSMIPQDVRSGDVGAPVTIEVYASPARPISASVVNSVVQDFVNRVETAVLSVNVSLTQLVASGVIPLSDMGQLAAIGQEISAQQITAVQTDGVQIIDVQQDTAVADSNNFNPLVYFAPGMAITFLMYTVSLGGGSILKERDDRTLARLLVTPSSSAQIIGGKVLGIFLTGVAQVGVLVGASTLFFSLNWGDPFGVVLLILTVAIAATGWGILLASVCKTPSQVTTYGSALMLIFGLLGGGLVALPRAGFMELIGRITPNSWALDGFIALGQGHTAADIITELIALVIMGVVLFAIAVVFFRRNPVVR
ncbi:MAG: ABC transporter permease [Anaerolinea sp.]|nr:ABC transporter permease [Anaerolinea sp.]